MFGFSLAIVTSTKTQLIITHYRANVAFFLCPPPLLRPPRARASAARAKRLLAPAMSLSLHTPPLSAAMSLSLHTPPLGSAIVPLAQYAFAAGYVAIAPYAAFGRGYVAIAPYAALGAAMSLSLHTPPLSAAMSLSLHTPPLGSAIVPLAQYAFAAGYVAIAPYARFFYRASHQHGEGHQIESTQSPDSTLHATVHCV